MSVYLIHFNQPYRHARHYIGFAVNIAGRMKHHRAGTGANLMRIIKEAGIDWEVARVWEGKDKHFERSLKNRKNTKAYCPICRRIAKNKTDKE